MNKQDIKYKTAIDKIYNLCQKTEHPEEDEVTNYEAERLDKVIDKIINIIDEVDENKEDE